MGSREVEIDDHEDRLHELEILLDKLEAIFVERHLARRKRIIPRDPPADIIISMGEVRRGKLSKADYMRLLYRTVYNNLVPEL